MNVEQAVVTRVQGPLLWLQVAGFDPRLEYGPCQTTVTAAKGQRVVVAVDDVGGGVVLGIVRDQL